MAVEIRSGDCLIAPPNCVDPRFRKTVIYVWEHSEAGSTGVIINRPTNNTLNDLVDIVPDHLKKHCMYWGGPVHTNLVFTIHTLDWTIARTNHVNKELGVTSDPMMFEIIGENQPNEWKVFFGHAAWAPGQLEGELSGKGGWKPGHSWLVLKQPTIDWVFNTPTENQWDTAIMACSQQAVESWI